MSRKTHTPRKPKTPRLAEVSARAVLVAELRKLPYIDPAEAAVLRKEHPASTRRACAAGWLRHEHCGDSKKQLRITPDDALDFSAQTDVVPCPICAGHRRPVKKLAKAS